MSVYVSLCVQGVRRAAVLRTMPQSALPRALARQPRSCSRHYLHARRSDVPTRQARACVVHTTRPRARGLGRDVDMLDASSLEVVTVAELKGELRARGLSTQGTKDDLIRRVMQSELAAQAAERADARAASQAQAQADADGASTDTRRAQARGEDVVMPHVNVLFPDGGPMPPSERVSDTDLRRELKARGARYSDDRQALYDRLQALVLSARPLRAAELPRMSRAQLAEWLRARGAIVPQRVSKARLLAMVRVALTQQRAAAAATAAAARGDAQAFQYGGYAETDLLAPHFDPAALCAYTLRGILAALCASTEGRQGELAARLGGLIDVARHGVRRLSLAADGRSEEETRAAEKAARTAVASLPRSEREATLTRYGCAADGSDVQVAERLIALMVVESLAPPQAAAQRSSRGTQQATSP